MKSNRVNPPASVPLRLAIALAAGEEPAAAAAAAGGGGAGTELRIAVSLSSAAIILNPCAPALFVPLLSAFPTPRMVASTARSALDERSSEQASSMERWADSSAEAAASKRSRNKMKRTRKAKL